MTQGLKKGVGNMNTKGRFYIWLNMPTINGKIYYWSKHLRQWTGDAYEATMFDTIEQAEAEQPNAEASGEGPAIVAQATKDLPEKPTTAAQRKAAERQRHKDAGRVAVTVHIYPVDRKKLGRYIKRLNQRAALEKEQPK